MRVTSKLDTTFVLPAHVTAAAFSTGGQWLAVGSDDGSIRIYEPPEEKVKKAVRGLGDAVSSVVFHEKDGRDCWVAAGRKILRFDLTISKIIYTVEDAIFTKEVGEDEDDSLNQIVLSENRSYLAITSDSGSVWVLDVKIGELSKMRASHTSIAWTVAFIPDRPSELISGGYDCSILHFDFKQRTLLGRFEIFPSPSLAPGISSLPPFITSLAISASGGIAAGTADGRIWVGLGGEKNPSQSQNKGKRKRTRKWSGLSEEEGFETKVGEGMVTGLAFMSPNTLVSCSLNGKIIVHELVHPNPQAEEGMRAGGLRKTSEATVENCVKVDMLAYSALHNQVAVGGIHTDTKRGVLEFWSLIDGPGEKEDAEGSGTTP